MNWFLASTPMLVIHAECIPISMRSIGSSGTPDECPLPVEMRTSSIEMNRTVFFIENKFTK
jgi:hypothetical protein